MTFSAKPLRVAVQMDPIQSINIKGDSTFAMMLEAQARSMALFVYTPQTMALESGHVTALVQNASSVTSKAIM